MGKAHQTISYRVTAATITIPTAVTYPVPTGCTNFVVTDIIADGICVATLAYNGATVLIARSAAANYSTPCFIPVGDLLVGDVVAGSPHHTAPCSS